MKARGIVGLADSGPALTMSWAVTAAEVKVHVWQVARKGFTRIGRYTVVSLLTVPTTQVLLVVLLALGTKPLIANFEAVILTSVIGYVLYVRWVWADRGVSGARERIVYWATILAGLVVSTLAITWARSLSPSPSPFIYNAINLSAFGLVWVFKFIALDRFAFRTAWVDTSDQVHRTEGVSPNHS